MNLSLRTWITFFLLAILMGLNNVYSTLLTGWGDGGSIVAVILCLLLLPRIDASIRNYNLGQTVASAGGSVGFTVAILASIYVWYSWQGVAWEPDLFALAILVAAVALMGVTVAVPMRRYIIHWFFPSAVACATILKTVTSTDLVQRARATRIMMISGLVSAAATLPTKIALTPGAKALWSNLPLVPSKGLSLSLDPLMYGIGIVIGPRIGLSMLLGALLNTLWLIPWLVGRETAPAEIGEYVRWSAVGLMTLPAFASMIFAVLFRTPQVMPPGFTDLREQPGLTRQQALGIVGIFAVATAVTIYSMNAVFDVTWPWVVGGILMGAPMVVALGKVAAETNINPVRLLAIVMLFVFSLFGAHSPVALLAMGICGAAMAAIAVDLFYDLRTGHLVQASPRHQILLQFLGVIPAAFVCVYFLHMLSGFGIGEGEAFPAPGAVIWATMADAFSSGASSLSRGVIIALVATSVVGILLALLEAIPKTKPFTPSAFAMGIALLLPFEMSAAIALGGVLRWGVTFVARKQGGEEAEHKAVDDAFQAGSAIFAASALTGILAVLLISLGLLYLPAPG